MNIAHTLPYPAWWFAARNRLLASPRFQRWAIRFPLTRWIARRRARSLFDLCAGFVYSQVLYACVTLGLFEHLAEGPRGVALLALRLSLPEEGARRLLQAAASLGLVQRHGADLYGLGPLGAALRGNPGALAMIRHHALLYADLEDPVALLRGEPRSRALASYWPYAASLDQAALATEQTSPYTTLMAQSQAMVAAEVLSAYSMRRHRCLLDVGGGNGAFLAAAAAAAPDLRLMLFDLPPVVAQAEARFAGSNLKNRAVTQGGDFRFDALPKGADIASLVRVVHDHDDDVVMVLMRAVHDALPDGGTILLAEPMAETPGAEPIGHAYFGFYLMAMGRGRPRSAAELTTMLAAAGFSRIRAIATGTPMITSALVALKRLT